MIHFNKSTTSCIYKDPHLIIYNKCVAQCSQSVLNRVYDMEDSLYIDLFYAFVIIPVSDTVFLGDVDLMIPEGTI